MAATKIRTQKKSIGASLEETHDESRTEGEPDIIPSKVKAEPIELDDAEPLAVVLEEKLLEDDPLNTGETEEDEAAEISLDGEELNPFGDRWEE